MSSLELCSVHAPRFGLKGPRAADWLAAQGITVPAAPNTWVPGGAMLLVARLGGTEFFIEDGAGGRHGGESRMRAAERELETGPPGVYPVLREDAAFSLCGAGASDVLAQVCNVNFADYELATQPVIMTLMIGVSVLVVPQAGPRYRIWCDPTFGAYLGDSLRGVVGECGGNYRGDTA